MLQKRKIPHCFKYNPIIKNIYPYNNIKIFLPSKNLVKDLFFLFGLVLYMHTGLDFTRVSVFFFFIEFFVCCISVVIITVRYLKNIFGIFNFLYHLPYKKTEPNHHHIHSQVHSQIPKPIIESHYTRWALIEFKK